MGVDNTSFDWSGNFRIKPEPKTRPWSKPEDVPGPVCYLRSIGFDGGWTMITGARKSTPEHLSGITIEGGINMRWDDLSDYEHSTDRAQWKPCTVTEE